MSATYSTRPIANRRTLVSFAIGNQAYALPLSAVQEIVPLPILTRAPGLPAIVEGFLNLGGKAVAVVSLARLFGQSATPSGLYTPLLILRNSDVPTALLVDRVLGLTLVSADSILGVNEHYTSNDCAEGLVMADQGVLVILSANRILLGQERACLAELQAAEQTRIGALRETAS